MTEEQKSPFFKLHVEEVTQAKRTLLDELNLPPKATRFIRDNAKILQNSLVGALVLICAWTFYDYYTSKQRNDSTAMLTQAIQSQDQELRKSGLDKVIAEYPRSGAAVWGKIALAHDLLDNKEYGKAKESISALLASVDKKDPLYPLLVLDVAQACEFGEDYTNALAHYATLREIAGFTLLGYLGEARVYELTNENGKARETYEKIKTLTDLSPSQREWVEDKLTAAGM
ncbi:MAG: tetratricopeptide repeat protein [Pseudomonadota bacterium]